MKIIQFFQFNSQIKMINMTTIEVLDKLFNPKSIAIVGASKKTNRLGYSMLHNLVYSNYKGEIYPINPKAEGEIFNHKIYPSIQSITSKVDLAIIVVNYNLILQAIDDCIKGNVKVAVVITAGFSEIGEKGKLLENEMITKANEGNLRLVGPNCMGVLSTPVSMSVMIWPYSITQDKIGGFSFISQSGNLGTLGLNMAFESGIGVSRFVSAGNASDLHLEDYLEYLENDNSTKVIGIYMEGIRDGRRFIDIATRVSKTKPVIVVKAGKNEGGARAAQSHTGSLSGKDELYDIAFRKAGIIRVDNFEEMIILAKSYLSMPLPEGDRVVVLTNGGGWGVMGADAVVNEGLKLESLSENTIKEISALLPPFWSPINPVDMIAAFNVDLSSRITNILLQDKNFDSLMLLGLDVSSFLAKINLDSEYNPEEVKKIYRTRIETEKNSLLDLVKLQSKYKKPIFVASFLTPNDSVSLKALNDSGYPYYSDVERMSKIYRLLLEYNNWKKQSEE